MCMIDGADEPMRCWNTVTRKARKEHKCQECGRVIAAGESYRYGSGIDYDGLACSHKVCAHCLVACDWLTENCGGWIFSGVYEDIREHVDEYRRSDLARIAIGMRRDWKPFRRAGLMPVPKLPAPIKLGELR
jgi:hypothetical protein